MVDETDKKILEMLANNPKITQQQIAKQLSLTPPAINSRIQRMKQQKIILGNAPIIDLTKVGYDITVIVNARIKNGKLNQAAQKWGKDPNVCSLHRVSGEYDMIITAKFHNTNELNEWNQKIVADTENIERTNTCLVFATEKEAILPNEIK